MNYFLSIALLLTCSVVASAQRPWIRESTPDVGPAGKVETVSNSLFLFDTIALRSFDHGTSWEPITSLQGTVCAVSDFTLGIALAVTFETSTQTARCYFSSTGSTWTQFDSITGTLRPTAIATIGESWFLAAGNTVYIFRESRTSVRLPDNAIAKDLVSRGTDLIASTSNGVYTSTDEGASWKRIAQDGIGPLHVRGGDVLAATTSGVRIIDVAASTATAYGAWRSVTIPPLIADIDSYSGTIYVLTESNGYQAYRLDGDSVWMEIAYPLPGTRVVITPSVFTIDAGFMVTNLILEAGEVDSSGVYSYNLNDFTSVQSNNGTNGMRIGARVVDGGILLSANDTRPAAVVVVDVMGRTIASAQTEKIDQTVIAVPSWFTGLMGVMLVMPDGTMANLTVVR